MGIINFSKQNIDMNTKNKMKNRQTQPEITTNIYILEALNIPFEAFYKK